jgi:hypothetical protein
VIRETRVRRWIVAQLLANATVVTETGGNVAPQGNLRPGKGISLSLAYAEVMRPTNSTGAIYGERFDFDIEAWGEPGDWSDSSLEAVADAADTALDNKRGVVDGINIECYGMAATVAPEDVSGDEVYQRLGRRYQTIALGP